MPHNRGRWVFKRGSSDILWVDGSEPFSESQQERFREHQAEDQEWEYESKGYCVCHGFPGFPFS